MLREARHRLSHAYMRQQGSTITALHNKAVALNEEMTADCADIAHATKQLLDAVRALKDKEREEEEEDGYRIVLAEALERHGRGLIEIGHVDEAAAVMAECHAVAETVGDVTRLLDGGTGIVTCRGRIHMSRGEMDKYAALQKEAVELSKVQRLPMSIETANTMSAYSMALVMCGDVAEAVPAMEDALHRMEIVLGPATRHHPGYQQLVEIHGHVVVMHERSKAETAEEADDAKARIRESFAQTSEAMMDHVRENQGSSPCSRCKMPAGPILTCLFCNVPYCTRRCKKLHHKEHKLSCPRAKGKDT